NAGRSQMAAALAEHLSARRVHVRSAGSAPAGAVNPFVIRVLAERGITLATPYPKPLSDNVVRAADVIITMGCGDACPDLPRQRVRGLERPRPPRPADRNGPRHPRRHPGPRHHAAARHPRLTNPTPPPKPRRQNAITTDKKPTPPPSLLY